MLGFQGLSARASACNHLTGLHVRRRALLQVTVWVSNCVCRLPSPFAVLRVSVVACVYLVPFVHHCVVVLFHVVMIVPSLFLASSLSQSSNLKVVLRRQVTVVDLGFVSGLACPVSSGSVDVSRRHFGSIGSRPAVSVGTDEFIRPCRRSAVSRPMLGRSSSLPGPPSPGRTNVRRVAAVGLDGSIAVLEASPFPDLGVGKVGASQVIIEEAPSAEDELCTVALSACEDNVVISGVIRVPVRVGGSHFVPSVHASIAHGGGLKVAAWLQFVPPTGVPVGRDDLGSGAELDSFTSDGHKCGGQCAWSDPCSSSVGTIGGGWCGATSAPRSGNDRCIHHGVGGSAGACVDAGTCSQSASGLDDAVAARSVLAKKEDAASIVGPVGCSYSYALSRPESNANKYAIRLYNPGPINNMYEARWCINGPPQDAPLVQSVAVQVDVACGPSQASGSSGKVARGSAVIFPPRVLQVSHHVGSEDDSDLDSDAAS